MMKNKVLIKVLYWASGTAFSFTIIMLIIHTIVTLSPKGSWFATQGGPLVTMHLTIPDTTVFLSYSGHDSTLSGWKRGASSSHYSEEIDRNLEYPVFDDNRQVNLKDSDFKKVFYFLKLDAGSIDKKETNAKIYPVTTKIPLNIDTYVHLKSQSRFYNFLFILRTYVGFLLIVFILYQITHIMAQLKLSINFNDELLRRIKWIGWFIIGSVIIKLILSIFYRSVIDNIQLLSTSSQEHFYNPIRIDFSSKLDFDISFFFLGLLILVIALIIQHGIQLQEESELTV